MKKVTGMLKGIGKLVVYEDVCDSKRSMISMYVYSVYMYIVYVCIVNMYIVILLLVRGFDVPREWGGEVIFYSEMLFFDSNMFR